MSGGWKTETDADAIHDNVAGEINALTEVTPVSGDWLVVEDTSDGDNKKKVDANHFLGGGVSSFSGVGVYRQTTDQLISASTVTAIEWNGEAWDTDNYHDNATNPTRLTVPSTGKYLVVGSVSLVDVGNGVDLQLRLAMNGTFARQLFRRDTVSIGGNGSVTESFAVEIGLTSGDYIEIEVFHGVAIAVRASANIWTHCQVEFRG